MSRPLKKQPIHEEQTTHEPVQRRPHLRIVRPKAPKQGRKIKHTRVIWIFLGVFISSLGALYFFTNNHSIDLEMATQTFMNLNEIYRQEGLQRFLEEKNLLKAQIQRTLEKPANQEEEIFASTIAVYLFPDIVPESNYEKSVAMEQWAPLEEAIEKSPRSPESRLWFEEMRANVWNYENPDRVFPKISNPAKEVLKIYDELSSP